MADILNNMIPVKRAGRQTVLFSNPPAIISSATVVGPMEGKGPLGPYFDMVLKDDTWGEDSWEKAERKMFEHTVRGAMDKVNLQSGGVDCLLGGDLLNQIISANFAAQRTEITVLRPVWRLLYHGGITPNRYYAHRRRVCRQGGLHSYQPFFHRRKAVPQPSGDGWPDYADGTAHSDRRRLQHSRKSDSGRRQTVWQCICNCGYDRQGYGSRHHRCQQYGSCNGAWQRWTR